MRNLLLALAVFLPQVPKQWVYRRLLKWKIGRRVRIGFSYLDAAEVEIGDDVRIGHFNVVRGVSRLRVGEKTYIANFNEFFGTGNFYERFESTLEIGANVSFMSHHFIDVAGRVTLGDRVTIGGRDTHFWSHTQNLRDGAFSLDPTQVCIGDDVYIGARVTLLGCSVPAGAVVGAGSIVTKSFPPEQSRLLIAGNPAEIRKRYAPTV